MMKVKLFYIILLFSIFKAEKSFSQDTIKINLLENYIFVAEISSLIIDSPNSYLYKIKIDSICYYTQNKILENKSDLLKIEYLETNKKLELGSKLILSAYFGYNKYYMILMRTFDLKNYFFIEDFGQYIPLGGLTYNYRVPSWLIFLDEKKIISYKLYKKLSRRKKYSMEFKYLDIIKPTETN